VYRYCTIESLQTNQNAGTGRCHNIVIRVAYPLRMRRIAIIPIVLVLVASQLLTAPSNDIQFIFTSDVHYGITRSSFRGLENVDAHTVNAAMVGEINELAHSSFPADGGLRSALPVGPVDFIAVGGDIANREEAAAGEAIQSAATSWSQFQLDYASRLDLIDRTGNRLPLYVIPGNHDASNAVGHYKPMLPLIDKTSMVGIFNLMMAPSTPKSASTYEYARDKVRVAHDIGGVHFMFITLWPDTGTRSWMESELLQVDSSTPVIVFAHDPPDSDSKHFINPNGRHDINEIDKFENLLSDVFADDSGGARSVDVTPLAEQKDLELFLRQHPNVTGYFHGHNNWNQFYDWTGPNNSVVLHTFRVDSPMKGHFSAADETKLSFQIATISGASRLMTVREVLWNADPNHPDAPVAWGASTTVALAPRPVH